ncbi:PTHB1 N-terminus [Carpediemonas membranifera]|uniref:PTHB1 N-terminus n=1 Tax=Carpediemonas membranifera TaxID=201153 RepID=A0A8J6B2N2_9EUKA|nr:PTHB1 N-terminus [Carpediemonas membranifera]|eukprot:KAG9391619.1 PTHB1 N-terminus [Carpediemonas membranifera]
MALFTNTTLWKSDLVGDFDVNSISRGRLDPEHGEQIVTCSIEGVLSIFQPSKDSKDDTGGLILQHSFPQPVLQVHIEPEKDDADETTPAQLLVLHPDNIELYTLQKAGTEISDESYVSAMGQYTLARANILPLENRAVNLAVISRSPLTVAVQSIDATLSVVSASTGLTSHLLGDAFLLPGPMAVASSHLLMADCAYNISAYPAAQLGGQTLPVPTWTSVFEDEVLAMAVTPNSTVRQPEIIVALPTSILVVTPTTGRVVVGEHLIALAGASRDRCPAALSVVNWTRDSYNIVMASADGQIWIFRRVRTDPALTLLWRSKIDISTGDTVISISGYTDAPRGPLTGGLVSLTTEGKLKLDCLGTTPRVAQPPDETITSETYAALEARRRELRAELRQAQPPPPVGPTLALALMIDDSDVTLDIAVELSSEAGASFSTEGLTVAWAGGQSVVLEPMMLVPGNKMATTLSTSLSSLPDRMTISAAVSGQFSAQEALFPVQQTVSVLKPAWADVTVEPKPVGLKKYVVSVMVATPTERHLTELLRGLLEGDSLSAAEAKNAVTLKMPHGRVTIRGRPQITDPDGPGKYKIVAATWAAADLIFRVLPDILPNAVIDRADEATLSQAMDVRPLVPLVASLLSRRQAVRDSESTLAQWQCAVRLVSRRLVAMTREKRPVEDAGVMVFADRAHVGLGTALEAMNGAREEYTMAGQSLLAGLRAHLAQLRLIFPESSHHEAIEAHLMLPELESGDYSWPEMVETSLRFLLRRVLVSVDNGGAIQPRSRDVDADAVAAGVGAIAERLLDLEDQGL